VFLAGLELMITAVAFILDDWPTAGGSADRAPQGELDHQRLPRVHPRDAAGRRMTDLWGARRHSWRPVDLHSQVDAGGPRPEP
jgi:hypothetical protein